MTIKDYMRKVESAKNDAERFGWSQFHRCDDGNN